MKTIKDLREKIRDLPDDMPITMFYDGGSYTSDIVFRIMKLWSNRRQETFFVIDRAIK